MLRYGYTKNDYDHYGVGSFDLISRGANAHLREHAVQVTETAILSPKIVSETNFLFLHQYHTHQADTTGPTLEAENAFSGGPDPETFSSYLHHHYQVQNITTIGQGAHTIRIGARLRAVSMVDTSYENFGGTFTFGGAFAPRAGRKTTIPQFPVSSAMRMAQHRPDARRSALSSSTAAHWYFRSRASVQMSFGSLAVKRHSSR